MAIPFEQYTSALTSILKTLLDSWYYTFFPAVIILFYLIYRKLRKIEKDTRFVANYIFECIKSSKLNPEDFKEEKNGR